MESAYGQVAEPLESLAAHSKSYGAPAEWDRATGERQETEIDDASRNV